MSTEMHPILRHRYKLAALFILVAFGLIAPIALAPAPVVTTFKASPAEVFVMLNDLHNVTYRDLDPEIKETFEGPGIGSVYRWSGNPQVGKGEMTIIESKPNERLVIYVKFNTPVSFMNSGKMALDIVPNGGGSRVTSSISGDLLSSLVERLQTRIEHVEYRAAVNDLKRLNPGFQALRDTINTAVVPKDLQKPGSQTVAPKSRAASATSKR